MNPGSFFREVLESHEFQLSDIFGCFFHTPEHTSIMSDNANLLDMTASDKVGRFMCYFLVESAALI